jgi:predicted nucleotidyltransferase
MLEIARSARRTSLLREAVTFVRTAARLAGTQRIALIGSILTDRSTPKDIDLLVTIADHVDLAPLAAAARRLQGRLQSQGAGADVFLANAAGLYIGRTCPWRECWPGRRASCDARHCGQRPHLHDDLDTIRLAADLVRHPPVVLHPPTQARTPLPADVAAFVAELALR